MRHDPQVLPTIAAAAPGGSLRDSLGDTRVTAVLLLAMYVAFLVYTLAPAPKAAASDVEATPLLPKVKSGAELSVAGGDNDDEEEELPHMSLCVRVALRKRKRTRADASRAQLVHHVPAHRHHRHHGHRGRGPCHQVRPW